MPTENYSQAQRAYRDPPLSLPGILRRITRTAGAHYQAYRTCRGTILGLSRHINRPAGAHYQAYRAFRGTLLLIHVLLSIQYYCTRTHRAYQGILLGCTELLGAQYATPPPPQPNQTINDLYLTGYLGLWRIPELDVIYDINLSLQDLFQC